MIMIFTLVSAAQDKLVELMDSIKEMHLQEKRRKEEELKRKEEVAHYIIMLEVILLYKWLYHSCP